MQGGLAFETGATSKPDALYTVVASGGAGRARLARTQSRHCMCR